MNLKKPPQKAVYAQIAHNLYSKIKVLDAYFRYVQRPESDFEDVSMIQYFPLDQWTEQLALDFIVLGITSEYTANRAQYFKYAAELNPEVDIPDSPIVYDETWKMIVSRGKDKSIYTQGRKFQIQYSKEQQSSYRDWLEKVKNPTFEMYLADQRIL